MPDISWNFHENPFNRHSMTWLTNTDPGNRKIDSRYNPQHPENVPDWSSSRVQHLLKVLWKSVQSFPHNVADKHGFPWKYRKRNPASKGLTITPLKFSSLLLCHTQSILKISWKSVHRFSGNVADREKTYTQTNAQRWNNLRRSADLRTNTCIFSI